MQDKLFFKEPNDLTLIIKGREIFVENARFLRTMDTCADALNVSFPWEPYLDPELDSVTAPYGYQNCGLYLGDDLQMEGILYNVKQHLGNDGSTKELEIYTQTADVIDSSVRWPFEQNRVTLLERCEKQMEEFEIDVVVDAGVIIGGKFSRVEAEQTDMCFDHLQKLAAQRGLLISCTKKGELLIIKPNVDGVPVGTIEEFEPVTEVYEADFIGRNRFQRYEAIASSSSSSRSHAKQRAEDAVVPRNRFLTFQAGDALPGETLNAAEWRKNKSAADAMNLSFPVNSWYAPDRSLWQPNTLVTVRSPVIGLTNGFTFLITQVEYKFETVGISAMLQLKPPTVFTTGEIEEPWLSE